MVKTYLNCFALDTGATLLGLLQINAALFFFWRLTTLIPIQLWFDLLVCLVYLVRAFFFLYGCLRDDYFATVRSRSLYYVTFIFTAFALTLIVFTSIVVDWINWGHFNVLSFIGWLFVLGFNCYHWIVLRSFMNFEDTAEESGGAQNHYSNMSVSEEPPQTGTAIQ